MRFMGQNLRTARRFGSFGIANWERYERNTTEWQGFIRQLWKFQVLKNESPEISANIEDAFYSCSQGITDILVKLFVLSQMQAILNCSIGLIDSEKLTPDLIEDVFRSQLSNVSPIVEALRKADYRAIERYEDVTFYEILAEELALRDMDGEPLTRENYSALMDRIDAYLSEFDRHGTDHISVDLDE